MQPSSDIRFDGWTLRSQSGELLNGGKRIRLQDQPLHILEELLARPGELVTREQLIARLWPKGVVDFDTALNSAVRRLRGALGDEAETPRYIETIPRRGYRFIGTVAPPGAPEEEERRDTGSPAGGQRSARLPRWSAIAAVILVASIVAMLWYARHYALAPTVPPASPAAEQGTVKSIAVLPFDDLSAEQDQQYFSDGLAEELLNLLSRSQQLRVIARTSSFSFKGENVDIATVARKLNVTHVLEGSVRKSGNRVRVTAQLIDASTSSHMWSQTYELELTDTLEVQGDIAGSVARALQVTLGDQAKRGTTASAQAYERFFRAQFFFQRRAPGDLKRAERDYRQALELDPEFARAWAGLAGVYWIQMTEGALAEQPGLEKLRHAAERALQLDPALVEAHYRMALYLWRLGKTEAANDHHRRAALLEPNNPLALTLLASSAMRDGRFDEGLELQRRSVAADPLALRNRATLGEMLYLAGRFDEAKAELFKVLELDSTHSPDFIGFVLVLNGQLDEALALIEGWPEGDARTQCLALVYHGLGRSADASAALDKLIESAGATDPFRIAEVHAYRGEVDEAFAWLQKAADRARDTTRLWPGRRSPWVMRLSPFLKPLHADPRWHDAWQADDSRSLRAR